MFTLDSISYISSSWKNSHIFKPSSLCTHSGFFPLVCACFAKGLFSDNVIQWGVRWPTKQLPWHAAIIDSKIFICSATSLCLSCILPTLPWSHDYHMTAYSSLTSSCFSLMSASRKNSHTLMGEPKKAICPLQRSKILSKAWKISLRGWWMVTTIALPVPAITCRLFSMSREEAESRPDREGGGRREEGKGEWHMMTWLKWLTVSSCNWHSIIVKLLIELAVHSPDVGSSRKMMFGMPSSCTAMSSRFLCNNENIDTQALTDLCMKSINTSWL